MFLLFLIDHIRHYLQLDMHNAIVNLNLKIVHCNMC